MPIAMASLAVLVAATAAEPEPFVAHGGAVRGLAVVPGAARLVSAGFDYSVVVWDAATGRPLRRFLDHEGPVNDVAATGDLAASASDDGTARLWDVAALAARQRLDGHGAKVAAVALSADGSRVASAGWDGTVRLWSTEDGREWARLGTSDRRYTAVAFVAGDGLAAADHTGGLTLWRLTDRTRLWQVVGTGFPVTRLLAGPDALFTGSIDGTIRAWALDDGAQLFRLEGQEKPVLSLAATADATLLASGTAAGTIYLWNVPEARGERVIRSGGGAVWSLAFADDGRTLYSGHADGAIRVWDTATGEQRGGPQQARVAQTDRMLGEGRGAALFRKCSGCHSVTPDDENKAGPTFFGLIGRRAGSVPGYPYSPALAHSDVVWTEETLSRLFELGPERFVPGSKMPLQRMPDPRDRSELVSYIARVTNGRTDGADSRVETDR